MKIMKILLMAVALLVPLNFARAASEAEEGARPMATAVFAGGCFWCVEEAFESQPGVIEAVSGYTGGRVRNPTYEQVSAGSTGHAEAVRVEYDPRKISYDQLLDVFWHNIDPTVKDRQFCDVGSQYRSAIFFEGEAQRLAAEASRDRLLETKPFSGEIFTEIVPATTFYEAEDYHQDYSAKNPIRYNLYRRGCGRDRRLKELWGDPS